MTFNDLNKLLDIFKEHPKARVYVFGEQGDCMYYGCRLSFTGQDDICEVFKRLDSVSYPRYFLDKNPTDVLYDDFEIEKLDEIL